MHRIQFDISYKNLSTAAFALLVDFFEYFGTPDWLLEQSNKSGALKVVLGRVQPETRIAQKTRAFRASPIA